MKCEVKIPTKLNKSCDMESTRYALAGIQVVPFKDKDENRVHLVATDSRKLCVIQAEGEASEKCVIPGDLSPKNAKEHAGTVAWVEGENGKGQWTRFEYRTKLSQRSAEPIEGRFPNVASIIPENLGNRRLTLVINPRYLLEAWEAMSGNKNDSEHITLLIEIPQVVSILPDTDSVSGQIFRLREGMSDEQWKSRHLCFAMNWHGEWLVDTYPDANQFQAAVMGKYDFYNDIDLDGPGAELYDTPDDLAYIIMRPIREKFETDKLHVSEPIAMVAGGNFGIIMPCCASEEKRYDWKAEYERLAKAFVEDYNHDPKSEPAAKPQNDAESEAEAQDDSEPVQAGESVSEPLVDDAGDDMEDDYNEEPDVTDLEPDMEPEIEPEAEFEPVANYEAANAEDFDLDAIMDGIF